MAVKKIETPRGFFFVGQLQHALLLVALVPGAFWIAEPALSDGSFLGVPDRTWFLASIAVPIFHQIIVWLAFRAQLVASLFTRIFGKLDMVVWGLLFFPLLILRPVTTIGLALADAGSLGGPPALLITIAVLLLLPVTYTMWSIARFFGFGRALGGDHFRQHYRDTPLVKRGAFRYSSNAMYTYAFLALWSIALLTQSRAALATALFQHAYIWVHMYCTEEPDMRLIHGATG